MARVSMVENINKDIQVHMNAMHSRKHGKTTVKRAFTLVLNGVLISSMLLGSITLAGCQNASEKTITKAPTAVSQQVNTEDETTYIANLKLAIKAINETITSQNWSATSLDSLCKSLAGIEAKLNLDGFKSNSNLLDAIKEADKTVKGVDISKFSNIEGLKEKHTNAVESLARIKNKLGIQDEQNNQAENSSPGKDMAKTTDDAPSSSNPQSSTSQSEVAVPKVNTVISKPSTESVTNNPSQQAQASVPAASTVPDKYKGYNKVSVRLITVNSDEMIFVKYGNHTYGAKNQEEYNYILSTVEAAVRNGKMADANKWAMAETIKGVKYTNYSETDPSEADKHMTLKVFQKSWAYMLSKVGEKEMTKVLIASNVWTELGTKSKDPGNGLPSSAYDILKGRGDCDAQGHLQMAVADVLGFKSRMINDSSHADAHLKAGGLWWNCGGKPVNPNVSSANLMVKPTY